MVDVLSRLIKWLFVVFSHKKEHATGGVLSRFVLTDSIWIETQAGLWGSCGGRKDWASNQKMRTQMSYVFMSTVIFTYSKRGM